MELKQYIEILKKNIVIIVLVTLFGTVIGFYFSKSAQTDYQLDETFFISSQETTPTDTAQNNYYNLEKSRDFTDTAIAILQSEDFTSGLTPSGPISVRKQAPQVVKITANAKNAQEASSLMENTKNSFNEKIQTLLASNSFQLKPIGNSRAPQAANLSPKIAIVFGSAAGFVVSIIVISLKTYFRL